MKLKKKLKSILEKINKCRIENSSLFWKRLVIVLIITVVIICSTVLVILNTKKESKQKNQSPKISENNDEQKGIEGNDHQDLEKNKLKTEFMEKCDLYNKKVEKYNSIVDRINELKSRLLPLEILDKNEDVPYRQYVDENFDLFYEREESLDVFDEKISTLTDAEEQLKNNYISFIQNTYKYVVDDYNAIVDSYNTFVKTTSIDNVLDLSQSIEKISFEPYEVKFDDFDINKYYHSIESIVEKKKTVLEYYKVVDQITNPSEEWIINRIQKIEEITAYMAVTPSNDPNRLLGKEGGYTSCIYFSDKHIDQNTVEGTDVIAKGTDCGGCIEAYRSLAEAKNRCDYLSQFDGTILYTGSYALVGTIIIRTSYKLSDKEQVALTNYIIKVFTEIE